MDYRMVLRAELEKAIAKTGCTLSQLKEKGGPHIGNLSACLRGRPLRPISLKQLDKLTEVLGLPEGYYYEYYLAECFYQDRVAKPRMESFLFRCAELGKMEMIEKSIQILAEYPRYTELLFSVAENLYVGGYTWQSVFFYEAVIEGEKSNHSERIAISHYRIFRASIGADSEENYQAVIRFESFRNKLPEGMQLDALLQLTNVCYSLELWSKTLKFAEELRVLSNIVYQEELRKLNSNRPEPPIETERNLVVYYGKSYLMKSAALSKQVRYEEAKAYIKGYEDLSWFKILDDSGRKDVANFSQFAKLNRYCIELRLGNTDILDEFEHFLTYHPDRIPDSLLVIVEAANTHGFNIDHILERFADAYPPTSQKNVVFAQRHFRFHFQKALYHLNQKQYEAGLEELLYCLSWSTHTHRHREALLCIMQFEKYMEYASDSQKQIYNSIDKQVGYCIRSG